MKNGLLNLLMNFVTFRGRYARRACAFGGSDKNFLALTADVRKLDATFANVQTRHSASLLLHFWEMFNFAAVVYVMDHSPIRQTFESQKLISTAGKSILNLVKL